MALVTGAAKIRTLERLLQTMMAGAMRGIRYGLEDRDRSIVLCNGVFDILHPGHLEHLKEAKRLGDILIVGVTPDDLVAKGPGRPIFSQQARANHLAALEMVDYVVLGEGNGLEVIERLKPQFFVKGKDYEQNRDGLGPARDLVESYGGKVVLTNAEIDSSSRVSAAAFKTYPDETERWLEDFRKRHSADEVLAALDSISDLKVLTLTEDPGERDYVFVERYPRVASETFMAVKELRRVRSIGVGCIAKHAEGFVATSDLYGPPRSRIGGQSFFTIENGRPYFQFAHNTLTDPYLPPNEIVDIEYWLWANLLTYDVVIVCDLGLGMFDSLVRETLKKAKFLAVNPKLSHFGYPNIDDYSWPNMIFGNEDELSRSHADAVITRAERGLSCGDIEMPSLAVNLVDTTGCGDAMLALVAPLRSVGVDPEIACFIGSCASAMQAEIEFNVHPIDPTTLRKFITRLLS